MCKSITMYFYICTHFVHILPFQRNCRKIKSLPMTTLLDGFVLRNIHASIPKTGSGLSVNKNCQQ